MSPIYLTIEFLKKHFIQGFVKNNKFESNTKKTKIKSQWLSNF